MSKRGQPARFATPAAKFAASERHDARLLKERKAREAANIARTLELKSLRLAKEAQARAAAAAQDELPKAKQRKLSTAS